MILRITHLYPRLMNIYGDRGNITSLVFRCQQRGIEPVVTSIRPGERINPSQTDLIFGGGGQDQQQLLVAQELKKQKSVLAELIEAGVPGLLICGSYQLFGQYFKTAGGEEIPGIGILDLYTIASSARKIGNVVLKLTVTLEATQPSIKLSLVGFENHSGNTFLGPKCQPLGKVQIGFGNNGSDKTEGATYRNLIGTYLHGSLLPKNPHLADHLILLALRRKYNLETLKPIDDRLEWQAHQAAIRRARQLKRRSWLSKFAI